MLWKLNNDLPCEKYGNTWTFSLIFLQLPGTGSTVPVAWAPSYCNMGKDLGLWKNPKLVLSQQKWYQLGTVNVTLRSFLLKTQKNAVHRQQCRRLLLWLTYFLFRGIALWGGKDFHQLQKYGNADKGSSFN